MIMRKNRESDVECKGEDVGIDLGGRRGNKRKSRKRWTVK
jgi:hypothetical protein